ncbi:MAG: LPS-assembly protein LptD, partial [Pseudomonadota bacterium]
MTFRASAGIDRIGSLRTPRIGAGLLRTASAVLLASVFAWPFAGTGPAHAQGGITGISAVEPDDPDSRLLLNADELIYNRDNDSIQAAGSVQIYYQGNVLLADSVTLFRKSGRLVASGNVRLEQPDGTVLVTDQVDLTDDFAEGFITALRLQSSLDTQFAAESAERTAGNTTVFNKGVYNACRFCATEGRRPTWQIKSRKIIHNQQKKTISYRDARLEFLGVPLLYSPYFSHSDPTLKRKTGLLAPTAVFGDDIGYGARIPYFVNVAPNMDVTLAATPLSRQGVLLDGQWRHRTLTGEYSVGASGIRQSDPDLFGTTSGNTRFRGMAHTQGYFQINNHWMWGWSATAATDRSFLADYNSNQSISASTTSNLYLRGIRERNYFRVEGLGFLIQQEESTAPFFNNLQERQPVIHPVLDYSIVFDKPILGGELALDTNTTALSRGFTDLDNVGRINGPEGNYSRTSANLQWRRRFVDPIGQVFTPFAYLRTDAYLLNNQADVPTATFADGSTATLTDDAFVGRVIPAAGFEYRYPLVSQSKFVNQVIEPIGQIVVRPDEDRIGDVPNDDAQSLVFDDSTLFDLDKFSGFDRAEGGTRANIGVKYTLQFINGAYISTQVGRSFQLAGQNSFTETDLVATAIGSGLDESSSDYVARAYIDTRTGLHLGARTQLGADDFEINRTEIQAVTRLGPALASLTYAFVNENDDLGVTTDLAEIQASGSVRITRAFRAFGSMRYDLEESNVVRSGVGLGYDF